MEMDLSFVGRQYQFVCCSSHPLKDALHSLKVTVKGNN